MKLFESSSLKLILVVDEKLALSDSFCDDLINAGYALAFANSFEKAEKYLRVSLPYAIVVNDSLATTESGISFMKRFESNTAHSWEKRIQKEGDFRPPPGTGSIVGISST
jgi:DNA-binding NtrC family response regulator